MTRYLAPGNCQDRSGSAGTPRGSQGRARVLWTSRGTCELAVAASGPRAGCACGRVTGMLTFRIKQAAGLGGQHRHVAPLGGQGPYRDHHRCLRADGRGRRGAGPPGPGPGRSDRSRRGQGGGGPFGAEQVHRPGHPGGPRHRDGPGGDKAGPHRFVSLLSREAADELGLVPGMLAVAAVTATSVSVKIAATRSARS